MRSRTTRALFLLSDRVKRRIMIRIGCCGYPVSKKKYYEAFDVVELNRTFYEYLRLQTVLKWREEAPEGFEFTVKAHQDISHRHKLELELAREPFERMKEICRILRAEILLVQTPASFRSDSLDEAERFFEDINREGMTLVWETRGPSWEEEKNRENLGTVLERLAIPHVTDPFRIMPVYTGRVAYFRLHGLGERAYYYQYTDEELLRLLDLVGPFDTTDRRVYVLFNNLSMFEDGKRFLSFIEDGRFPSLTGARGIDSVRAVISKTRYPVAKGMLVRKLGWRLVELEDGGQIRLREILKGLPSKTYRSVDEILEEIDTNHLDAD